MEYRVRALAEISAERRQQDAKWGEQNHDPVMWLAILGEEVGEAARAALKLRWGPEVHRSYWQGELQRELIQVAAVVLAFLECLDRGTWTWGAHANPQPQDGKDV